MPKTNNIVFSHKEVAEVLIKAGDIHEGLWGLYIEFGLNAANIGPNPNEIVPAAILGVNKIGIQRFKEINSLSVDAAEVNPVHKVKVEKK